MRRGEEIQQALRKFVTKWAGYSGGERAEAQTFLYELFACYGSDRLEVGARFEDFTASAGFMDRHWPGECIVEMKAQGKEVSSAREQVERYWEKSADEKARQAAPCHPASWSTIKSSPRRPRSWWPRCTNRTLTAQLPHWLRSSGTPSVAANSRCITPAERVARDAEVLGAGATSRARWSRVRLPGPEVVCDAGASGG